MEKQYQNLEAFRGIEEFEYLWLLWEFEPMGKREWSPTVRPPKLGGNVRRGVFATRSPNRPNPIGLTKVRLLSVEQSEADGPVLTVAGADLMSGTSIFDIKPYLPFADSSPDAAVGDYGPDKQTILSVDIPANIEKLFGEDQLVALKEALSFDPRPGYQNEEGRSYGFQYACYDIRFTVSDDTITVTDAVKLDL